MAVETYIAETVIVPEFCVVLCRFDQERLSVDLVVGSVVVSCEKFLQECFGGDCELKIIGNYFQELANFHRKSHQVDWENCFLVNKLGDALKSRFKCRKFFEFYSSLRKIKFN